MGSCQSWLHRHKAGGGPTLRPECPKYHPAAFHRVYPGGSNNWQLHGFTLLMQKSYDAIAVYSCIMNSLLRYLLWWNPFIATIIAASRTNSIGR